MPPARVTTVTFGNNMRTRYTYDNAERLANITHERLVGLEYLPVKTLEYDLDAAGRITKITESDYTDQGGLCASWTRSYDYDKRNRLVAEQCVTLIGDCKPDGYADYRIEYTYDLGGNRRTKVWSDPNTMAVLKTTIYHYDIDQDLNYRTFANRLVYYEVFDDEDQLAQRVDYAYNRAGNPYYIVTTTPGDPWHYGLNLYYTRGNQLWLAVKDKWQLDAYGHVNNGTHQRLAATEYLSDGVGIARWLVRSFQPTMQSISNWTMLGESLRDFAGNGRHEDYTLANSSGQPVSTPARFYLGGMAHLDYATGESYYTRGDQVRSNVLTLAAGPTPTAGTRAARNMFTAFGEQIASTVEAGTPSAVRSRYGYVGAFGYEGTDSSQAPGFDALAEAGLLHVGARHYDPATGRLIERDPVGLLGGLNVYVYVRNMPTGAADPSGNGTIGLGLDASITVPGFSGSIGPSIQIGHNPSSPWYSGWSGDVLLYGGAGLGGGASLGVGPMLTITNATGTGSLTGLGWQGGGTIGPLYGGATGGTGYLGGQLGWALWPDMPGLSASVESTFTISLIDLAKCMAKSMANSVHTLVDSIVN